MKTRTFYLSALTMLAVIAIIAPAVAYAQGTYTGRYSKRDVDTMIKKLENSSDKFRRDFDKELDRSSINGTQEENRLNAIVRNYEIALDDLRRDFDNSNTWWQGRRNVQRIMNEARQVNGMMNNLSFARRLERQWNAMRRDINKLADTYDIAGLGETGTGNGNAPSWAVGTFNGRNPQTGGTIQMIVSPNGNVVVNFENGTSATATMIGDRLVNEGAVARVTRIANGFRTTRLDNGESIDYYISGTSGGGFGGGTGGNVPSWAIGTFYSRNPQTGGNITMTINRSGSVTISFENGSVVYATLNGERLNNNGIISVVSRIGNGIRTTRVDNGERIDYYVTSGGSGSVEGGNVPSWARGRFYGRNPQTGGTITLDIANNGNVVITFENGTTAYATVNGERMYSNGIESRLSRTRNGIRTTRVDNGEVIDYRR